VAKKKTQVDPRTALLDKLAVVLDEKKAFNVVSLDMRAMDMPFDAFLIASGSGPTHLGAMAEYLIKWVKAQGMKIYGREGIGTAKWALLDLGSVVVHLFDPEARTLYDLETLWEEAIRKDYVSTSPAPTPEPEYED